MVRMPSDDATSHRAGMSVNECHFAPPARPPPYLRHDLPPAGQGDGGPALGELAASLHAGTGAGTEAGAALHRVPL